MHQKKGFTLIQILLLISVATITVGMLNVASKNKYVLRNPVSNINSIYEKDLETINANIIHYVKTNGHFPEMIKIPKNEYNIQHYEFKLADDVFHEIMSNVRYQNANVQIVLPSNVSSELVDKNLSENICNYHLNHEPLKIGSCDENYIKPNGCTEDWISSKWFNNINIDLAVGFIIHPGVDGKLSTIYKEAKFTDSFDILQIKSDNISDDIIHRLSLAELMDAADCKNYPDISMGFVKYQDPKVFLIPTDNDYSGQITIPFSTGLLGKDIINCCIQMDDISLVESNCGLQTTTGSVDTCYKKLNGEQPKIRFLPTTDLLKNRSYTIKVNILAKHPYYTPIGKYFSKTVTVVAK